MRDLCRARQRMKNLKRLKPDTEPRPSSTVKKFRVGQRFQPAAGFPAGTLAERAPHNRTPTIREGINRLFATCQQAEPLAPRHHTHHRSM
jgi:hypothetical protein